LSRKKDRSQPTDFELARDELFSHIHRCGVLKATEDQQVEWMVDTIDYLGERYPELEAGELEEIKAIGMRFCRPVIANQAADAETDSAEAEGEEVAVA
jgi:hypothetical protein